MTKQQLLDRIGGKGIMDLYHKTSSPMWLILDGNIFVTGSDAGLISHRDFTRTVKQPNPFPTFTMNVPGFGNTLIYGIIYLK